MHCSGVESIQHAVKCISTSAEMNKSFSHIIHSYMFMTLSINSVLPDMATRVYELGGTLFDFLVDKSLNSAVYI